MYENIRYTLKAQARHRSVSLFTGNMSDWNGSTDGLRSLPDRHMEWLSSAGIQNHPRFHYMLKPPVLRIKERKSHPLGCNSNSGTILNAALKEYDQVRLPPTVRWRRCVSIEADKRPKGTKKQTDISAESMTELHNSENIEGPEYRLHKVRRVRRYPNARSRTLWIPSAEGRLKTLMHGETWSPGG